MSATIKPPITGGSLSLSLAGGDDRDREAVRTYRIVEQFRDLKAYSGCAGKSLPADLIYPLTGSIGMDEVVRTFAESAKPNPADGLNSGLLMDKLTFTTKMGLGTDSKPGITFTSTNTSAAVSDATFSPFDQRKDIHKVTVVVSWDKPDSSIISALDRRMKLQKGLFDRLSPTGGTGNLIIPYQTQRVIGSVQDAQNDALLSESADTRLTVITELNRLRALEEERQRQIDGVASLKELIKQVVP